MWKRREKWVEQFSLWEVKWKNKETKKPIKIKEGWEEELKRQTGIEKQKDRWGDEGIKGGRGGASMVD